MELFNSDKKPINSNDQNKKRQSTPKVIKLIMLSGKSFHSGKHITLITLTF